MGHSCFLSHGFAIHTTLAPVSIIQSNASPPSLAVMTHFPALLLDAACITQMFREEDR